MTECGDTLRMSSEAYPSGGLTSLQLTEACLDRIARGKTAGDCTFLSVYRDEALETAARIDRMRQLGEELSPMAGVPVAIKDNMDVAGEVTLAGSLAAKRNPPAEKDAAIVKRLRSSGAILIGRTNMVEFAYSGLGINPHYGTPQNPLDPARVPGGSSSGTATAVANGYVFAAIGTDTAGSVRVPAAFCGLVGFKPTQSRFPINGIFPLAPSLDSVGFIGASVRRCAILDGILSGGSDPYDGISRRDRQELRLAVLEDLIAGSDEAVSGAFSRALRAVTDRGVKVERIRLGLDPILSTMASHGGIIDPEAARIHANLFARARSEYDPRVAARIERGSRIGAEQYEAALGCRAVAKERFSRVARDFDALLAPTVPIVAPRLTELEGGCAFNALNQKVLSNARIANLVDGCAITIPCHFRGELPVGLMLMGENCRDARLLRCATLMEQIIRDDLDLVTKH